MHKKLVSLSLFVASSIASVPALAATYSIIKTSPAQQITVLSTGQGIIALNNFILTSTDFPSGTLNKTKTLTSVSYSVAAYPSASTDLPQLCYFRPYAGTASLCIDVTSGSTSSTTAFNQFTFGNGAQLQIKHTTKGTPGSQLMPSRQESVTFSYSY